jgi:hypothetical protein
MVPSEDAVIRNVRVYKLSKFAAKLPFRGAAGKEHGSSLSPRPSKDEMVRGWWRGPETGATFDED